MTLTPRRFLLSRGSANTYIDALTVEELLNALSGHVHLYDTAEMLAEQAWAGQVAEHGLITVSEVTG